MKTALITAALILEREFTPRYKSLVFVQTTEEPQQEIETFEQFISYDDVHWEEEWLLFGDVPDLIAWAEKRVLERTRKCEQLWNDEKARRKLLTQDLAAHRKMNKRSLDDFEADTYFEWDDEANDFVEVPFEESWYGDTGK